jgi:hypothetical protein
MAANILRKKIMKKTYVEFYYPGSFMSESSSHEVESRDRPASIPVNAYAYSFYDREETVVDGEKLVGLIKNRSPMTYFGQTMTIDEVKRNVPNCNILVSNMECNGWEKVVRTKLGNFQPLNEGDVVLAQ